MRSFFDHAPDAPCERGRLLLISYHFPPGQAAGALRWRKLALYAFERGWGVDVITLDPADLGSRDDASLADLPEGIRVFGIPDPELEIEKLENRAFNAYRSFRSRPGRAGVTSSGDAASPPPAAAKSRVTSLTRDEVRFDLRSPRAWARAYWSWIDFARGRKWARRVVAAASRIFDRDEHRLVISCGPPHMVHEAARRLSRDLDIPMVMDLRDPWSLCERLPEAVASPVFFRLARFYERRAVRRAGLVVMNTEFARRAMQRLFPQWSDIIVSVPNAYDEKPVPKIERDRRFLVAYAGTVYLDRTPLTLFQAAARLVRERSLTPEEFGMEFMGHIGSLDGETIEEIAAAEGLSGYVHTHPPAEYASAERFMAQAAMLVSLPQDSHLAIPSKIFDYMRFPARLLALAEPESATAHHLRDSGADVVAPFDVEGVLAVLRDAYRGHTAGERVVPIARDPRFSRRSAAKKLFEAIDTALKEGTDPSIPSE